MSALAVPYLAGALLLVVAGVSKLAAPDSTVTAARHGGLGVDRVHVRVLAVGEVVAGTTGVVSDGWVPAALVGALYLSFAAFLARRVVHGDLDSCGCFAGDRAEPSWVHVAVNVGFSAASAVVAAGASAQSLSSAVTFDGGWATLTLASVVASLSFLMLSRLPSPGEVPGRLLIEHGGART